MGNAILTKKIDWMHRNIINDTTHFFGDYEFTLKFNVENKEVLYRFIKDIQCFCK